MIFSTSWQWRSFAFSVKIITMYVCNRIIKYICISMNNADLSGRANLVERVHIVVVGGIADAAILRALAL